MKGQRFDNRRRKLIEKEENKFKKMIREVTEDKSLAKLAKSTIVLFCILVIALMGYLIVPLINLLIEDFSLYALLASLFILLIVVFIVVMYTKFLIDTFKNKEAYQYWMLLVFISTILSIITSVITLLS